MRAGCVSRRWSRIIRSFVCSFVGLRSFVVDRWGECWCWCWCWWLWCTPSSVGSFVRSFVAGKQQRQRRRRRRRWRRWHRGSVVVVVHSMHHHQSRLPTAPTNRCPLCSIYGSLGRLLYHHVYLSQFYGLHYRCCFAVQRVP